MGSWVSRLAVRREHWQRLRKRGTSKAAFEELFAAAAVPILMLHGHDLILEVANDAALAVLGGPGAVGRPLLDLLPEIHGQGCVRVLREVMATGVPHVREQAFIGLDERRPPFHGTSYWTFTCTRWKRADESDRVVVVFADVTDQVHARKKMEALAAEADAANRAKDQFFATLSHELRNPLSPILTALELMRLRGLDTPEQSVMERQIQHLVSLVDDLLDVSRIARGQLTLRRRPMELSDVVTAALETVNPLIANRRQRLTIDVPHGLGVDVDPQRMTQVVSNLLTNAARYSPDDSEIIVTAAKVGSLVRLAVIDRGIGIDSELLGKVFDAFAQYATDEERSGHGLGLGLTIVAHLVQLHGGSVHAHSDGAGKGSEFVVELPWVSLHAESTRSAAAPRPEHRPHRQRLLVVDDNVDAAETLASALASVGYETRVAHDGASALEVAEAFLPQAALVDIGLPVMSGYEVASRLRVQHGGIRLIAITGYGQAEDKRRTTEAGFQRHFVKPVALDAVRAALEE